ncbi:hypothetical protein ILUMI_18177 [Ignelater luminosus]|uniref:Uncharacterized protein n=1 Tax=Ignelater luminosus TaxID=2038154 RepID=A0A8K0CQR0_IGNLU|nr:hypothetical protein ILUMI_18177 [Ignelater luminosus]
MKITHQTVKLEKEDFACIENESYKENDCNNCDCGYGELECSRISCSNDGVICKAKGDDGSVTTVDDGYAWNEDCNRC